MCKRVASMFGIQTLSLSTDGNIQITNGNTISLPDNSPSNELQSLTLNNGKLSLSQDGGVVTLPDDNSANELQQLSLSNDGTKVVLNLGGGSADLTQFACATGTSSLCTRLAQQESLLASLQSTVTLLSTKLDSVQQQLSDTNAQLVGTIIPHGSANLPSGWLLCNGDAISRSTYSRLFAVIGITYGLGDGISTFNLPDLRGRTVVGSGAGAGLTNRTINTKFGSETVSLAVEQLPSHNHPGSVTAKDGGHDHGNLIGRDSTIYFPAYSQGGGSGAGYYLRPNTELPNAGNGGSIPWKMTDPAPHTHSVNVASQGSGAAVPILPPSITLNYVIKY